MQWTRVFLLVSVVLMSSTIIADTDLLVRDDQWPRVAENQRPFALSQGQGGGWRDKPVANPVQCQFPCDDCPNYTLVDNAVCRTDYPNMVCEEAGGRYCMKKKNEQTGLYHCVTCFY